MAKNSKKNFIKTLVVASLFISGTSAAQFMATPTTTEKPHHVNKLLNTNHTKTENKLNNHKLVMTDDAITDRIKSKITAHHKLAKTNLSVSTSDGVVSLSGDLSSKKEALEVFEILMSTQGVKKVNLNGLTITTVAGKLENEKHGK
jgi:osmotically-inducible protein OsmY